MARVNVAQYWKKDRLTLVKSTLHNIMLGEKIEAIRSDSKDMYFKAVAGSHRLKKQIGGNKLK